MDVMTAIELTDNEFLRQFEATFDGKMAKIEYSLQDRKIFLTKINMPEGTEDKMNDFIVTVFKEVEDRNISLVPTSPEIAKFMRSNRRKYKKLLPVGINI
ncbi:GNAT family N-acetyltransferase [Leeuwenhoekiella sp. MAR_2009_132]|uniref:GNAT family N-acetyltransferase n=1 Tax=unclassified Leeuwenhoekiella TaxID=2615029 RepID=UPI0009DDC639|nr:N-acetyltransferase [Leeuwenhoekiella sp. MAR_2009_132]MDP5043363.1 N-acetyltransferase [Leeuwenhoekiella sp.]